jgi:hypothetical protein
MHADRLYMRRRDLKAQTRNNRNALVVLAAGVGTVDTLLRHEVAHGLEHTALSELSSCEVVDAVLELVDWFHVRHFGLVELV